MNPARAVEPRPDPEALKDFLAALLAFETGPGRFALALREPRKVFEHLRLVLQLSAGRAIEAPWPPEEDAKARQAARFFVRTAMLRPGADHYTLLGLAPGFEPEALKDHYRMMIRLTHPDFASPADAWPADAAARINIANTVLASPTEREAYTAQMLKDREGQTSLAAPPAIAKTPKRAKVRDAQVSVLGDAWARPKVKAWAFGLGVLACLTGLMLANPGLEDRTLKARSPAALPEDTRLELNAAVVAGEKSAADRALQVTTGGAETEKVHAVAAPNSRPKPAAVVPKDGPRVAQMPVAHAMPADSRAVQSPPLESAKPNPLANIDLDERKKSPGRGTDQASMDRAPAANATVDEVLDTVKTPATSKPGQAALEPAPKGTSIQPRFEAALPPVRQPELVKSMSSDDVRAVMQGLAKVLESGRGRNAYAYLAPEARTTDSALQFVRNYQDALKGQKVLQINKTAYVSADDGDGWLVRGTYELVLEDYPGSSYVKNLTLQARFVERQGKTVLTRITLLPVAESSR